MRTKSKGVRRNSCGYGLENDVRVAADVAVSDDDSSIHALEDLGAGVGLLSRSDAVSGDTAVREHGFGPFLDVDRCLVPDPALCGITDMGVRPTGGITIREPDSYCDSGPAGSDRVSGFVDYLGKGKRKVDDMFPVSCHASDTTTDPVSAPLAGGHAIDDAFCPSSCPTGAGTSNTQCAFSHMNAVCTDASTSSVMPTVMPAVHDVLHLGQDGCSAVPMPTPPAYESEWRVPVSPANTTSVSAANTTSVHVDMGAVGPGVSAPPAAVASPPVRRRPRRRVTHATATRRALADSSTPGRNIGGAPTTYTSLGRCNRVCRHCNALFWFEERLKQGGVRFPEYHHC